MKKILFIAHENNLSGANQSLINLCVGLKADFNITVLVPRQGILIDKLKTEGINYKLIKSYRLIKSTDRNYDYKNQIKNNIKRLYNIYAVFKICKYMKKERFELVHNNSYITYVGIKAAKRIGIPYICHIRDFLKDDHRLELVNEKEVLSLVKDSNKIITISEAVNSYFLDKLGRNFRSKFQVIYNGLSLEDSTFYRKNGFSDNKITILSVGRIQRGKGQLDLIKALTLLDKKILNKVKVQVIGSSPIGDSTYEDEIKSFVRENSIEKNVEFIPFTNDVLLYREKSDVAVITSDMEAFGRVTVEAFLASQLVIASNSGANVELVSNEIDGLLYEKGNPNSLAEKISWVLLNKDKSLEIQKAGFNKGHQFSIKKTISNVKLVYQELLYQK